MKVQPVEISSFIKWEDGLECNDTSVTISVVEASRVVYNHFDFFAFWLDLAFPLKWLVLYEQLLVVTNFFGVWDRYMELKSHAKIESEIQSPKRRHQKFSLQCMISCWSVTKEFQMRTIALNHISHSILFSNYILFQFTSACDWSSGKHQYHNVDTYIWIPRSSGMIRSYIQSFQRLLRRRGLDQIISSHDAFWATKLAGLY